MKNDRQMSSFSPTDEQKAIVAAPLCGVTKIRAFSGAGKTSVLEMKAYDLHLRHGMRGLYLAFNKSAQLEAEARFGSAAVSRTPHALAYRSVGRRYVHKLRQMRPREVVDLGMTRSYEAARLMLDLISAYCMSDAVAFPTHAPRGCQTSDGTRLSATEIASLALMLWERMVDATSPFPMSHDGYLKLYQLSNPRLPGDYLMVDEFQDTNPVVLAILAKQPHPLIAVGDPYQSIYQFRGAVNAMSMLQPNASFSLTYSHRFGPKVAEVANTILSRRFEEKEKIVGAGPETVVYPNGHDFDGPHAVLTRTNAELFVHAHAAWSRHQSLSFIGPVEGYQFDRLVDAHHLRVGAIGSIKDPFLRAFTSSTELSDYAEEVDDHEARRIVQLADSYGSELLDAVPGILSSATTYTGVQDSCLTLGTAHKAKGSTLPHVRLGNDFKPLLDDKGHVALGDPQEAHLLYMALTRARHSLTLNASVSDFLVSKTPPLIQ